MELLRQIENVTKIMEKEPAFIELKGKILIAGDTHGDLIITKEIIKKFIEENFDYVVFLGDYIDRAPSDVGSSLPNINFLLEIKEKYPRKVFLLKGNHEANYAIPCFPYEFEREVESKYPGMHEKYVNAFKQMPLMAMTNGIFAAHGGILKGYDCHMLKKLNKSDVHALEAITWSDPVISNTMRGAGYPYDEKELKDFLDKIEAKFFIKGHDYTTLGMLIYEKCITLFSSRRYACMGNGGILVAEVLDNVENIEDIKIKNYSDGRWEEYRLKQIRL
ncbi:MAG: hypothetical protein FE048_00465 [Thermoplasmata archaeon]|nr:MAG: hypothetical protein FE048_00465 [Thermoplasmata archaeon]